MSRTVVYVFSCGHGRIWSDVVTDVPTARVVLDGPCEPCRLSLERARAKMRRDWGRLPSGHVADRLQDS